MLAVLLVSGVACKQSSSVQAPAQTISTDTPEIAALRVKANAGDADAQYNLGNAYYMGQGVPTSLWWKFEYGIDMIDRSYYTAGHGDGDPAH